MNQLTIMGNLGADPEVRFTSSGLKVTTLRVAANQKRSGKEETTWWRVTIWGEQFDKMMPFLKKGSSIIVMGEMSKPEIYNNRDGQPQISLNMTAYNLSFSPFGRGDRSQQQEQHSSMGGDAFGGDAGGQMQQGQGQEQQEQEQPAMQESAAFSDDEIPF